MATLKIQDGYLEAGDDVDELCGWMTVGEAKQRLLRSFAITSGFCFTFDGEVTDKAKVYVHFKRTLRKVCGGKPWNSCLAPVFPTAQAGYLPDGDNVDELTGWMTLREAKLRCLGSLDQTCGFCFQPGADVTDDSKIYAYFKKTLTCVVPSTDWVTYLAVDNASSGHKCEQHSLDMTIASHGLASDSPTSIVKPPFHGTGWFTKILLTKHDSSSFAGLKALDCCKAPRNMFDRRRAAFCRQTAWVFEARFGDRITEVQVNLEFSQAEAKEVAEFYCATVGRLPRFLLRDVDTMWIHKGCHGFGGGNNNLLIHTDMGKQYIAEDVLEEMLIHEATHTSMDAYHLSSDGWKAAMKADLAETGCPALSHYAADWPEREDLAEFMAPYLAVTHRANKLEKDKLELVRRLCPNRIKYLDRLNLTMDI